MGSQEAVEERAHWRLFGQPDPRPARRCGCPRSIGYLEDGDWSCAMCGRFIPVERLSAWQLALARGSETPGSLLAGPNGAARVGAPR
jgi:hypothetical protein